MPCIRLRDQLNPSRLFSAAGTFPTIYYSTSRGLCHLLGWWLGGEIGRAAWEQLWRTSFDQFLTICFREREAGCQKGTINGFFMTILTSTFDVSALYLAMDFHPSNTNTLMICCAVLPDSCTKPCEELILFNTAISNLRTKPWLWKL